MLINISEINISVKRFRLHRGKPDLWPAPYSSRGVILLNELRMAQIWLANRRKGACHDRSYGENEFWSRLSVFYPWTKKKWKSSQNLIFSGFFEQMKKRLFSRFCLFHFKLKNKLSKRTRTSQSSGQAHICSCDEDNFSCEDHYFILFFCRKVQSLVYK